MSGRVVCFGGAGRSAEIVDFHSLLLNLVLVVLLMFRLKRHELLKVGDFGIGAARSRHREVEVTLRIAKVGVGAIFFLLLGQERQIGRLDFNHGPSEDDLAMTAKTPIVGQHGQQVDGVAVFCAKDVFAHSISIFHDPLFWRFDLQQFGQVFQDFKDVFRRTVYAERHRHRSRRPVGLQR